MECTLAIRFNDFALLASDTTTAHSVIAIKKDDDKLVKLSDRLGLLVSGASGDTIQFAEYIAKNIQLYKMRNGYELSPNAAANFTRRNLADYLRSRTPYNVNLLMAGCDKESGEAELYFIDYLASMVKLNYAAHGYGSFFILGILDRHYRPNMTSEEGYGLLKKCVAEVQHRFIVNLPRFNVRIVDKDGIRDLEDLITTNTL